MTKRRQDIVLNLPLETNSQVLEKLTITVKSILEADGDVIPDSVRVYFDQIDSEAIKLKIYLYTHITNFDEFLEFKTRINLLIVKALEMENIHISYPGENVYIHS